MLIVIPTVSAILEKATKDETLIDTVWAISYISDAGEKTIPHIIEQGIIPSILKISGHSNSQVAIPALRAIGNFVTGSDEQTDILISHGLLHVLHSLIGHSESMIRKETVWTLSNVCAGSESQIMQLIDLGIMDNLIELVYKDSVEVQREAVWGLSNTTALKNPKIIQILAEKGIVKAMSQWLKSKDSKTLVVLLEGLSNILEVGIQTFGREENQYCNLVEECGALDTLEELQEYPNQHVYELALSILENYFPLEEVDLTSNAEAENMILEF